MAVGSAAAALSLAAYGCGFAGRGGELPPGHPDVSYPGAAPDNHPVDSAGGAFVIPGGGITVPHPSYDGNTTTAANLYDALKEGTYGRY